MIATTTLTSTTTDYDDLESGCTSASSSRSSSIYSREDESDVDDSYCQNEAEIIDVVIAKKFIISRNDDDGSNKPPRRLSQCVQLVSRRPRPSFEPSSSTQPTHVVSTNSNVTTTSASRSSLFCQLWEMMTMPWNKSAPAIYKCSLSHYPSSPASSSQLKQRFFIRFIVAMVAITLFGGILLLHHQQRQISTLQSQLTIINQHRLFLEKKQSELFVQIRSSDASLEQCKHTHKQMANAQEVVGSTMGALRRELSETMTRLVRCQEEAAQA
jgi:hypothetical protein